MLHALRFRTRRVVGRCAALLLTHPASFFAQTNPVSDPDAVPVKKIPDIFFTPRRFLNFPPPLKMVVSDTVVLMNCGSGLDGFCCWGWNLTLIEIHTDVTKKGEIDAKQIVAKAV